MRKTLLLPFGLLITVLALITGAGLSHAAEPDLDAANAAADYIISIQNPDGGFPGFNGSSPGTTLDGLFALIAADRSPVPLADEGPSPIDYLEAQAADYATDPGSTAKLTLGIALAQRAGAGVDLRDFGGVDLIEKMEEGLDGATGAYGLDLFDEALYVLAQIAAGEPMPIVTGQHLRSLQRSDGGWEFAPDSGSDTNTTSLVLQAILALPNVPDDPNVKPGMQYLLDSQHEDGGFGFIPGEDSDPHSTAFVIQTLIAANEDIDEGGVWAQQARPPLEALAGFQNPATGAFQFFGEDSAFSTYQAVPGVMLAPFPFLETMEDGVQPIDTPVPVATTEITPAPPELPAAGAGGGASGGGVWIIAAALAAGGALAAGAGVARRRAN